MDIDEFLDKELKAEKEKKEETKEKFEKAEEVSEEKKDNVKRFLDLWGKVSAAKFKWDGELYKELSEAGGKVKKELDNVALTVGRQKKAIKRLVGKALNEIENNNYDEATKLYSEISDMQNKVPEFMLEEKKELNSEIFSLYAKLHNAIDAKFVKDFKESIAEINNLADDAGSAMGSGDIEKSRILYEKALESYKNLPNGFMQKKIELGSKLLGLYKELSIRTQIYELQSQLGSSLSSYANEDRMRRLAEMVKSGKIKKSPLGAAINEQGHVPNKTLLNSLVARKLERAKINFNKESYDEARRNLESVLKVDPRNAEAKVLLSRIPVRH